MLGLVLITGVEMILVGALILMKIAVETLMAVMNLVTTYINDLHHSVETLLVNAFLEILEGLLA